MPRRISLVLCLSLAAMAAGCGSNADPDRARRSSDGDPSPRATAPFDAAGIVRGFSDEQLVGAMLMPHVDGASATSVPAAVRKTNDDAGGAGTPAELVRKYSLGGVILMRGDGAASNIDTPGQVRDLTAGLQHAAGDLPMLIGVDQEHGVVTRLRKGVTLFPSAMAFGAAGKPELTERAAEAAGAELAAVGINVNFAPTADVTSGASNVVIGSRSYGGAAKAVEPQVAAAVRGYEKAGIAATLKHFPGHGHTATDSHKALPVLTQSRASLLAEDVPPFAAGIKAGASLVMAGHLVVGSGEPATFNSAILVDLLRTELGFDGVVITDAMNMGAITSRAEAGEAAVRAVLGGNDLVLMPDNLPAAHAALLAALRSGRLPRARVVASVTRLVALRLRLRLGTVTQPALSSLGSAQHREVAAASAAAAVTVLRGGCGGPLVRGPVEIVGSSAANRKLLGDALAKLGIPAGRGQVVNLLGYADDASAVRPAAVTVALDTPYLLADAPSPVLVAAYSSVPASIEAVAAVLAGKAPARGRSPVAVRGLPVTAC